MMAALVRVTEWVNCVAQRHNQHITDRVANESFHATNNDNQPLTTMRIYTQKLILTSGVVANLELCMGTLGSPLPLLPPSFLSAPLFSFPSFPYPSLSPLSGGNNFNDFIENQLTTDFTFFASMFERTLKYHRSPCPDIIWRNGVPHKIFGGTAFPRVPPTTPLILTQTNRPVKHATTHTHINTQTQPKHEPMETIFHLQ